MIWNWRVIEEKQTRQRFDWFTIFNIPYKLMIYSTPDSCNSVVSHVCNSIY